MSGTTSGVAISRSGEDINLQIFRGKTLNFDVIWGGTTPIDITGYQASLEAVDLDGGELLVLSSQNGGVSMGGPNGKISLTADPATTQLVNKPGRYELELTNSSGDIYRVISGSIAPIEDIAQ